MFLSVISPLGAATSLDLAQIPIWRLELRATQVEHSERKALALGIGYVTAGTRAFATIAALDCQVTGSEVDPIAAVGFPHPDRQSNKERIREALKALINTGMVAKEVEEISAASAGMVDAYHDILQACWGMNPALASVGPVAKGELQGWRWALLSAGRFSPWIAAAVAPGSGMAAAPGSEPMAPAPGSAAATAAELRPNPLGEPPGTEKKAGKGKNKPAAEPAAL